MGRKSPTQSEVRLGSGWLLTRPTYQRSSNFIEAKYSCFTWRGVELIAQLCCINLIVYLKVGFSLLLCKCMFVCLCCLFFFWKEKSIYIFMKRNFALFFFFLFLFVLLSLLCFYYFLFVCACTCFFLGGVRVGGFKVTN